jgi:hypothetical protein
MFLYRLIKIYNELEIMKSKTVYTKKTDSWVLPGDPISLDEFKAGIKEAEKGSFMTLDELKKGVEEWKKTLMV